MAPYLIASWNFTNAPDLSTSLRQFITDRSLILGLWRDYWADFVHWLSQPQILACVITWLVVFAVVLLLMLGLGFGPAGVVAGSLAAAFQAWAYGAFTPAAGIFATLTSLAMLGMLAWWALVVAACVATIAAAIVWACGVGA